MKTSIHTKIVGITVVLIMIIAVLELNGMYSGYHIHLTNDNFNTKLQSKSWDSLKQDNIELTGTLTTRVKTQPSRFIQRQHLPIHNSDNTRTTRSPGCYNIHRIPVSTYKDGGWTLDEQICRDCVDFMKVVL